jgi:predicted helicase
MYDDTRIKWSRDLKLDLERAHYAVFSHSKVRRSLNRPYCKQWLFFDRILNEEVYQLPQSFPTPIAEEENVVICVPGIGNRKAFGALVTNIIPKLDLAFEAIQCFPYYTYNEDGTNRRENITDWALSQFQAKYGTEVTKWDIFHYVYAMLHHPQYRERYAENLKRDLPHIPLLHRKEAFLACVSIGKQLMDIHLNYEQAKEYPLEWIENQDVPLSWRVEKMRLTPDRSAVIVNESLTLSGIPQECFQYRLGNRSALDWVIEQYQISEDKRSGIVSDPNNLDDEEYIVHLVRRVITVSVETVRLVNELAQVVKMEDWMNETVEVR